MMNSPGSFYIQKRNNPRGWRLMRTTYFEGKRKQSPVPRSAQLALGFSESMTIDQARARAHQLNAANTSERQEQQKITGIAARVERDKFHDKAFVPEALNESFLTWLENNTAGNEDHVQKMKVIWRRAKEVIVHIKCLPDQFAANRKSIVRFLADKRVSPDYARKIILVMNMYGQFCARQTGKFYEKIQAPRGAERELIADAYHGKPTKESKPLTPEILKKLKEEMDLEHWAWLHCSLWLGLRPKELNKILEGPNDLFWRVEPENKAIWVYQPKLVSLPRQKRWKRIPAKHKEQVQAIEILLEGEARAPLVKTLRARSAGLTRYGGRKGFVDLMLDRGHSIEDISQWLGHSSIELTWKVYKARLAPPGSF